MKDTTTNTKETANLIREQYGITTAEELISKRRQALGKFGSMSRDVSVGRIHKDYIQSIADVIDKYIDIHKQQKGVKPKWFKHLSYVPSVVAAKHAFDGCWDAIGAEWSRLQVFNCIALTLNDEILANVLASDKEGKKLLLFINARIKNNNDSPSRLSKQALDYASKAKKKQLFDREGKAVVDENNRNVFVDDESKYRWSEWENTIIDKVSSHLILCVMEATGLFTWKTRKANGFEKFGQEYLTLTEKGENELLKATHAQAVATPRFGPMLVKPNPWHKDSAGPYNSFALRKSVSFVKNTSTTQHKAIEGAKNDGSLDQVFEAVNYLQDVPYELNRFVTTAVHWVKVKNLGSHFKKYPDLDVPDIPPRLPKAEFAKLEDDEQKDYIEDRTEAKQLRSECIANLCNLKNHLTEAQILRRLEKIHGAKTFFMPHQLDYRGRVYHVNAFGHQHSDYLRAMFLFANKVKVTEQNAVWFSLQLANTYGKDTDDQSPNAKKLDKQSFEDRQAWTIRHENEILLLGKDWRNPDIFEFWSTADEPFQFLAACREWYLAKEAANRGEDYYTGLPIGIDATNSALQIYAAMGRNEVDGEQVNLIDSEVPSDIYTTVMLESRKIIERDIQQLTSIDLILAETDTITEAEEKLKLAEKLHFAQQWKKIGITRSIVKPNAMTWSYSATTFGFAKQIRKELKDFFKAERHKNDSAWASKSYRRKASFYLATVNMEAVENVVKSGQGGMKFLQKVSNLTAQQNVQFQYKTPLGFPVVHSYFKAEKKYKRHRMSYWNYEANEGKGGKGETVTNRLQYTDNVDRESAASGVAPNFVHSLDATILMKAVLFSKDIGINDIMVVHDSFSTTLDNVKPMRDKIATAFVTTFEDYCPYQDVLQQNLSRLPEAPDNIPSVPDKGLLDINAVYASRYFCS